MDFLSLLKFILFLVVGFALLVKGADWFVEGAAGVAVKLGIPEIIVGLTIVAMGTSAPEAAVSITSAFKGSADITIGNVVGSNIMNVAIILGLTAVITTIAVLKTTIFIDIPFTLAVTLVLLVLGLDGQVSRVDGVILWVLFIGYLAYLFIWTKKNKDNGEAEESDEIEAGKKLPIWKLFCLIVIGIVLIVFGSNVAVDGAKGIAKICGMSDRLIGLTIVALGTSLPELVTSVTAAKRGNADLAVGNIVGSNIFNILFVVGTSALIIPVTFQAAFIVDSIIATVVMVILFLCVVRKKELNRLGGFVLLISYLAYFIYLLVK
ncbi:calcium/sodium antiporter [Lachnospira sp.]|jgi:cation:H+ antiporter|uniref:calcium/sodium antiporter n=1 Tax=Lachnospira sp. TaxID=2049031 RepID=UPI00257F82B9|nr:calcium/sodium antiporter [Lachnospira sp.]